MSDTDSQDIFWMRRALAVARRAQVAGEVPVGAVLVRDGVVLAEGWNHPIGLHDPTAHAEVQVLRAAAVLSRNYRLPRSTLYVTLEPCVMCVGAMVHARVSRLVFGAREPKAGAVCSRAHLLDEYPFNWTVAWTGGVLADECAALMSEFFAERRRLHRQQRVVQVQGPEASGNRLIQESGEDNTE